MRRQQLAFPLGRYARGSLLLRDRCAAQRHADPAVVDCSFRDGQSGEHTDALYFRIREVTYSIGKKATRTSI
ncbi:hypothetical protein Tco_0443977, partial [Tanacetum coccineum]